MKFKLPLATPTGEEIAAVRAQLGLTQTEACERAYISRPRWADYEGNVRPIDIARWHLFLIRSGLLKGNA